MDTKPEKFLKIWICGHKTGEIPKNMDMWTQNRRNSQKYGYVDTKPEKFLKIWICGHKTGEIPKKKTATSEKYNLSF